MRTIHFILATLTLAVSLTGCYSMPTEDDYSVVPCVNNPAITKDKGSWAPQLGGG